MKEITLPLTFNALVIKRPGSPISAQKKTVTTLAADEVLIRVDYASINKMDPMLALRNSFQLPSPYVLGFDFSGEVILLGSEGGFQVGDAVFGSSITGGGYAEYAVVKKSYLWHRGEMPAAPASTYGIAYLSAYESLVLTGNLDQYTGKSIYVAGAAGGVGHFATQLSKLFGLKVFASAGKAASLELLEHLKVDHIIDYSKGNVSDQIMALTGGQGVDMVYESTYSNASYDQSAAVIATGGQYIRLGTQAHMTGFGLEDKTAAVEARGAQLLVGDLSRYRLDPAYQPQAPKLFDGLQKAVNWYNEGKLRPWITQTIAFGATALQLAFDEFVKGTINVGKVVVKVGSL